MSNKKPSPKDEAKEEKKAAAPEAEETKAAEDSQMNEEELRDSLDRFAKEAHKLAVELATEKDKYLRVMAEYDNFRKRSQKERENIYSEVRGDTVAKLLPVYDNLERALKQETQDEAYYKGVEMIMAQFREIMSKLGVTEIVAKEGEKFDPELHNAVMHIEDETLGEGIIVEEFQKGFRLGDKVLRFSVVKVAN